MATASVLCPHCNSKQKVPEHRLTEQVLCLSCQQVIADPWQHKIQSDTKMELAIKLKGRLVSEFGTTKLEDIKSKADDYTGHFEPVDEEEEELDDTGTKTRTKTQTDMPARGPASTTVMFDSGMYAALPSKPGMSTAAKTYIVAGILFVLLTTGVVIAGVTMLSDDEQKTEEIHASGGEGERVELYPSGAVKARWNVSLATGIEQEHGPYQEFYIGGEQKTLGSYNEGDRIGTWTSWHENGQKASEITYVEGKEDGKSLQWHNNARKAGEGQYIKGVKDGEWRTWHKDGRLASFAAYEKGEPIGEWLEFYPDGERKSHGIYSGGLKEGKWIFLRDNGSIELEEHWKGGVLHGETFGQHRDRGKALKGQWENGWRAGTWSWWHVNGQLKRQGDYKDGKETANWWEWHPNGQVKERGAYVDGRRTGTWEEFDEDGELTARREYSSDVVTSEQHYFRGTEVRQVTEMKDGKLLAEWTVLSSDVKHGYEHRYHANGERAESGAWINGKKEGPWRAWNEQGELRYTQTWKDGVKQD